MRRYIAIALAVVAVALIIALLSGCSSPEAAGTAPPPPKKVFIVKHMNPEGVPFATYRTEYAYAVNGCVAYKPFGVSDYSWACGNVSVTVEYTQ